MFNKVVLIGVLGADPQFTDANGISASFPLSTSTCRNEDYDDPHMTVDWHRIVAPSTLLKECKNLRKDDTIIVAGELKTSPRKKTNNDKEPPVFVYTTEVFAHTIKILPNDFHMRREDFSPSQLLASNGI